MDPKDYIKLDEEKIRYEKHNNDVNDPKYQQFVSPIVNAVMKKYQPKHLGLDFGAGTGPVVSKMLNEKGFDMKLYDPFFWNDLSLLNNKYDFIISSEVVEHFHSPKKEFNLLKSLLNENGSLYIMTNMLDDNIDFKSWYYKNDETHVFFYHKDTFEWIKEFYSFKSLSIDDKVILLTT